MENRLSLRCHDNSNSIHPKEGRTGVFEVYKVP